MYKFMPNNSEANPELNRVEKRWRGRAEPNTTAMSEERKKIEAKACREAAKEREQRWAQVFSSLVNFVRIRIDSMGVCARRMSVSGI